MTEKKDEVLEAIARLIQLTQEGTLKWSAASPWGELRSMDGFEVTFVFTSDYKSRKLRLFGFHRRVEDPGPFGISTSTSAILFGKQPTYPYWEDGVTLELTDTEGRSLWRFPSHSAIFDLLSAVRYQAAGVREFLNEVLQK